jgi:DNA invertase Pin-like site-specific DNA recombinase
VSRWSVAEVLRHGTYYATNSCPKNTEPGPLIGYARVSTRGQDLTQQRTTLREAGCARIFEEKISGANCNRPELGRTAAKARGVRFGPNPTLSAGKITHARKLIEQDTKPVTEVARLLGVHRATLYRALKQATKA